MRRLVIPGMQCLLACWMVAGCSGRAPTGTSAPSGPTPTVTIVPYVTPVRSSTPSSAAPVVPGCDPDQVVAFLHDRVPYAEFSLSHNAVDQTRTLNLWLVDPALDPEASAGAIADNAGRARWHAVQLAHRLATGDPCVARLFVGIVLLVVDREYNEWFTAQIAPAALPASPEPGDSELEQAAMAFSVGYLRDAQVTPPATEGLVPNPCTWPQARAGLTSLPGVDPGNAAFYLVINDEGVNAWAQWRGPVDWEAFAATLFDVAGQLACLEPAVDMLWVLYLDSAGTTLSMLTAGGEAIRSGDPDTLVESLYILDPFPE